MVLPLAPHTHSQEANRVRLAAAAALLHGEKQNNEQTPLCGDEQSRAYKVLLSYTYKRTYVHMYECRYSQAKESMGTNIIEIKKEKRKKCYYYYYYCCHYCYCYTHPN